MTRPESPAEQASLLALVGLAAYIRLRLFSQVAAHSWNAPTLRDAQRLARRAVRIADQEEALLAIGAEYEVGPIALMQPFEGCLAPLIDRTGPTTWWEGLLRPIVAHGVSRDYVRLLARGLEPGDAARLTTVLADDADDDSVGLELVKAAVSADPVLGARLALWGRRVVGEMFNIAAELTGGREPLRRLALVAASAAARDNPALPSEPSRAEATAWLLGQLSAGHAARMEQMGLAA